MGHQVKQDGGLQRLHVPVSLPQLNRQHHCLAWTVSHNQPVAAVAKHRDLRAAPAEPRPSLLGHLSSAFFCSRQGFLMVFFPLS